ncbi:BppU family phage baseplate upper protein [Lactococcus garvieae]|uniref:BppU family phage baseplate upper protein n=1 Tax=Lactococcus garvieae TaxID=1363 RepID=UPI0032E42BA6
MANKIFNLDLTKDTKINSIVLGRVGDGGLQTITVNISNRDVPVDLTGFTITFEGVTNSSQSKIFDSYGVKTETEKLKQGQFDYTFPSAAFSVAGRYETAYFSFQKDENRDTTGKIDIFVSENADIDAGEAESIITEYNKLVQELHEITDKYISDSDAKFADINKKISDLQTKITQYQNTVKDTADGAIKAVDDALKKFEAADFYTKSETDAKFKLTINDSGAIAAGTDLDSLNIPGFYAISNKKPDTEILNYPKGIKLSGSGSIYAQVVVFKNASSTMIKQVFYDQLSTREYYRSFANNAWQEWQLAAIDSEVVHLAGDETIAGKKTFTDDTSFKGDVAWTDINLTSQFTGGQPQVMVDRGKWLVIYLNDIKTATTLAANTPVNIIQLPVSMRTDRQQEKTVNIRIASEFVSCRLLLMSTGYIAVVPPKSIPSGSGFGITETFTLS